MIIKRSSIDGSPIYGYIAPSTSYLIIKLPLVMSQLSVHLKTFLEFELALS